MENNWQIQDDDGTIHSGTHAEMTKAWAFMTLSFDELKEYYVSMSKGDIKSNIAKYETTWEGDLKLIQIHQIYR